MKKITLHLLLFLSVLTCYSQKYQLQVIGNSSKENNIIDSLKYQLNHADAKSIETEINKLQQNFIRNGYLENQIILREKINDSVFVAKFNLGFLTRYIYIYMRDSKIKKILNIKNDSIILPYTKIETFLNENKKKLEREGFSLSKIKLINFQKKENYLIADLQFDDEKVRKINLIVVKDNNLRKINFPKGHLKQINKKYKNSIFNQNTVNEIYQDFEKIGFITQTKYPETLFTNDSTKVFVYLEKRNSNSFDGFIGFNNNETKKINFSGYFDLKLENILKAGEEFKLNWKSDGNNQKTFNTSLELPYILKSGFGIKGQINIFKQDSLFQNTKTSLEASYFLKYNTRIYLGTESTTSSDIQKLNNLTLSDFKTSYVTTSFEYSKKDNNNLIDPEKESYQIKIGLGKRESNAALETTKQFYLNFTTNHTFYINKKNHFNIKNTNFYLKSENYMINELKRFGGINSIRGFQESSLVASSYLVIATEYRYFFNSNFYINSIIDYAYYNNPTYSNSINYKHNLTSTGIGIAVQTKGGLLKISAANNNDKEAKTKFYNTLVHISYNVKF